MIEKKNTGGFRDVAGGGEREGGREKISRPRRKRERGLITDRGREEGREARTERGDREGRERLKKTEKMGGARGRREKTE